MLVPVCLLAHSVQTHVRVQRAQYFEADREEEVPELVEPSSAFWIWRALEVNEAKGQLCVCLLVLLAVVAYFVWLVSCLAFAVVFLSDVARRSPAFRCCFVP